MKIKKLEMGLAIIILAMGCKNSAKSDQHLVLKEKPIKVAVAKVAVENTICDFTYSGIIEPSVSTQLSFQSLGTVTKVFVDEGDLITKGQLLAVLDSENAESAYRGSLATQQQAKDAYDRLLTVYNNGSLPEIKWEEVKTKLEQANSAAEISKKALRNTELRAPYDGVVGSRKIELGTSVNPASTAFEVLRINQVYARISVPENEINRFKKGLKGMVNIPAVGADNFLAEVEKIGVLANKLSKTYTVKLRLENTNGKIKPGMVCDTKITMSKSDNALVIPMQAILNESGNEPYVFVVNEKEQLVSEREIKIGTFTYNKVQILAGLTCDELIVISGQHKLSDNMAVRF